MNLRQITLAIDAAGTLKSAVAVLRLVRDRLNLVIRYLRIESGDPVTGWTDAPLGAIYIRTDTGKLYVFEGGGWTMK